MYILIYLVQAPNNTRIIKAKNYTRVADLQGLFSKIF